MTLSRITLITSLLALVASTAFAGTIRVGPKRAYKTIQDGVDNASSGDKVLIDKGVYFETVVVTTADLTIQPAKKGKKGKVTISGGGSGTPLVLVTGADGCTAKDLTIVDSKDSGIVFGQNTGVRIIGCTVSGGAAVVGIEASLGTDGLISKCKVINVGGDGINIEGSSGHVVTKCTVKGVGKKGIKVNDSDAVTISNNKITNLDWFGIYLGESAATVGCLISGNKVQSDTSWGIKTDSFVSFCVFDQNTLRFKNGGSGAWADGATECLWTENVSDGSFWGFNVNDSYSTWIKNKSTDSGATGFYIAPGTDYLTLTKNKSRGAGYNGIEVAGFNHMLIKNDSRKSNRSDSGYVDFDTSGGTDCVYLDNTYGTSDL